MFRIHFRSSAKQTALRASVSACVIVTGLLSSTACAQVSEASEQTSLHFSADPSLLAPASSTTYTMHGQLEKENSAESQVDPPFESFDSSAKGTLIITDGVLTSIDLVATLVSPDDLRFTLSEPVLFQRRGEVLESVVVAGTLSTATAMYPETRVVLSPEETSDGILVRASIEMPESLITDNAQSSTIVMLNLVVQPLSTIDQSGPEKLENGAFDTQSE